MMDQLPLTNSHTSALKMPSLIYSALFVLAVQTYSGLAQVCPTAGVQCDTNCGNVILCPTVGATPTVLHKCVAPAYCGTNGTWYDCSHNHCSNPDSPHKFQCQQVGTFPSPYQCGKFFICTKVNDIPAVECVCKSDEYFDIPSQSCKVGACPRAPVDCNAPGDTGNVENYCYACSDKYDAYVYRCNFNVSEVSITPKAETCGSYTGLK